MNIWLELILLALWKLSRFLTIVAFILLFGWLDRRRARCP